MENDSVKLPHFTREVRLRNVRTYFQVLQLVSEFMDPLALPIQRNPLKAALPRHLPRKLYWSGLGRA